MPEERGRCLANASGGLSEVLSTPLWRIQQDSHERIGVDARINEAQIRHDNHSDALVGVTREIGNEAVVPVIMLKIRLFPDLPHHPAATIGKCWPYDESVRDAVFHYLGRNDLASRWR